MRLRIRVPHAPALAGVFVCFVVGLLAGCATPPQSSRLEAQWPADLPEQVLLAQVPFYPQEDYECGPASLAMAATAAGQDVRPEQLVSQVYLPGRQGSLQLEMLAATRRQGLLAFVVQPQLEDVLRELAAGHPVIVFQNLSLPIYPVWHYAVVVGYDRREGHLVLHSGRTRLQTMTWSTFERTWARGGRWAMLALPPDTLPATANARQHAASVAALERVQPAAAMRAYARALEAWPDERSSLLGHGNAAYAQGLLEQAEQSYRRAVARHPDFADAWNNLAQLLYEGGRHREALVAIRTAVALGGPRQSRYQALERRIAGALNAETTR